MQIVLWSAMLLLCALCAPAPVLLVGHMHQGLGSRKVLLTCCGAVRAVIARGVPECCRDLDIRLSDNMVR